MNNIYNIMFFNTEMENVKILGTPQKRKRMFVSVKCQSDLQFIRNTSIK